MGSPAVTPRRHPDFARNFAARFLVFALDMAVGRARPEGRLPFELPCSMAAVTASRPAPPRPDVPNGTEAPVFPYGRGLGL
ncbi:hypothetical protein [Streptomyces ipomoeae]|uniref:Uncharacterized protein n=1 Tax=Streptomyces ipomoeae 91-03 TaxID=698759 RepID=L1KHZ1_9ACTN|nr:hypothetical protein [Streptomyces ipomoeae]EKX60416.1 hypothetical protein STRIP9103_06699 [Streptomyces ipomoeae 91-03]